MEARRVEKQSIWEKALFSLVLVAQILMVAMFFGIVLFLGGARPG